MPIYEYSCQVCAATFDRLRPVDRMDDAAPCPDCGSNSQRQLSIFASFQIDNNGGARAITGSGGGCCGGGGCAC